MNIFAENLTNKTTICTKCKYCHKLYFWCYNRFCQHPRYKEIDLFFGTIKEGSVDCDLKNDGHCKDFEEREIANDLSR